MGSTSGPMTTNYGLQITGGSTITTAIPISFRPITWSPPLVMPYTVVSAPSNVQITAIGGVDFEQLRQMIAVGLVSKEMVLKLLGLDEPIVMEEGMFLPDKSEPPVVEKVLDRQEKELVRGRRLL